MDAAKRSPSRRIERVLVATDFSSAGANAIDHAVELASRHGATLHLVHAVAHTAQGGAPLEIQEAAAATLAEVETRVRERLPAVETTCATGSAWEVVNAVERETNPDLIIVGKRGHTAYARLLLGSTTDRVVRTALAPVLTIDATHRDATSGIATIVAPTDFSVGAARAAETAAGLLPPDAPAARMILVHAWQPIVDVYGLGTQATVLSEPLAETEAELRALLERPAAALRDRGLEVETIVREGYPAHVIESVIDELDADLVAMGTHGRGALQHLLLGSVAERVLHHARCPVLTVRHPITDAAANDANDA